MTSAIPESPVDRDALALLRAAYAAGTKDTDPFPRYLQGLEKFTQDVDDVVEVLRSHALATTRGGGFWVGKGSPTTTRLPLAHKGDVYLDLDNSRLHSLDGTWGALTSLTGAKGDPGNQGVPGSPGISIREAAIDPVSGNLIITLTNDSVINAGLARGEMGPPGGAEGSVPADAVRWEIDLPNPPSTDAPDRLRTTVGGRLSGWLNEWGGLRGTSPFTWGDALFRAIRSQTPDGITQGNFAELEDRRPANVGRKIWGRRWTDGRLVRNDILMSDVLVLAEGEAPPEATPDGTLIVRYEG